MRFCYDVLKDVSSPSLQRKFPLDVTFTKGRRYLEHHKIEGQVPLLFFIKGDSRKCQDPWGAISTDKERNTWLFFWQ
ncbi:hypothetical protein IscW_ISCW001222 [Ixodes scapularis]|uniref:Uncharacterized protein n=1 Tax=Ixodes scapularis TaxID=6945 RepID=B7P741_IXOSC|nr:hypothetical protein IscW_ISCW001222 [Ixodes scapularis]|eukprot:XP_002409547.1 hypothetical protein IscW_ISCW001222 [Ixodes scapularis]